MADRITDERLREIASSDPIAAELLAARARIAKLEQEPPMAMVDFGVGFNWKGLHEDMQRLRAERDAARAEVERLRCRVAVLERVRNEAEWVRKAYELDDNDDQGATDLCAALDAAKETDQ